MKNFIAYLMNFLLLTLFSGVALIPLGGLDFDGSVMKAVFTAAISVIAGSFLVWTSYVTFLRRFEKFNFKKNLICGVILWCVIILAMTL
jgi:hypothetical protein